MNDGELTPRERKAFELIVSNNEEWISSIRTPKMRFQRHRRGWLSAGISAVSLAAGIGAALLYGSSANDDFLNDPEKMKLLGVCAPELDALAQYENYLADRAISPSIEETYRDQADDHERAAQTLRGKFVVSRCSVFPDREPLPHGFNVTPDGCDELLITWQTNNKLLGKRDVGFGIYEDEHKRVALLNGLHGLEYGEPCF